MWHLSHGALFRRALWCIPLLPQHSRGCARATVTARARSNGGRFSDVPPRNPGGILKNILLMTF
jgi:hypothetical protein